MQTIETQSLTKIYKKSIVAVKDLNLKVKKGSIFGFLGPNASGKTTTIRMLVGVLKPTSGSAYVSGFDVSKEPEKVKKRVGYVPENMKLYSYMKIEEYLRFICKIQDVSQSEIERRVKDVLDLVGMIDLVKRKIGMLSRGQVQKVGIAQALLNDSEVLILDDPLSGLDVFSRREILGVLRILGKEGKTILVSSHILFEMAKICTDIGIIKDGNLVLQDSVHHITKYFPQPKIALGFEKVESSLIKELRSHRLVEKVERSNNDLIVKTKDIDVAKQEILRIITNSNSILNYYNVIEPNLGDMLNKVAA